ncbi:uncharacterized protein LOC130684486 [Manis pentadactyla]|uniref:uncharacterized protein LOC130684486 n=1 Tax=Manis pentadactyla TaxID=143292 RepID=UPI00255C8182|nr:uncharacterized protein LOC130684486 [Manis pentadactyla]
MAWKGGDSLKCVRGRRAPGNPEAWIRAENGTESAPLPRLCLLRLPGCRPLRAVAAHSPLTRSRGAHGGFSFSAFASSSSFGFSSSSSSSSSTSFPTYSPLSYRLLLYHYHTLRGTPIPAESPARPALPPLRPPDPEPAEPELVGPRHRHPDSSCLAFCLGDSLAYGDLGWPREHREALKGLWNVQVLHMKIRFNFQIASKCLRWKMTL